MDTDWIIDCIAEAPAALDVLDRLSKDGLAASVITLGELLEGAYLSSYPEEEMRIYRQFLDRLHNPAENGSRGVTVCWDSLNAASSRHLDP